MKNNKTSDRISTRLRGGFRGIIGSVAALALSLPLAAGDHPGGHPGRTAFTKVVAFGDSMTDMGNFHGATGVPPFPYWNGRVSDGPVWVEYLAAKLRIPLDPADNYAWLGSMTGSTNFRDIPEAGAYFPGFEQQLAAFLADAGEGGADPDALYTVWIGANDFFDWLQKQGTAQATSPEMLIATGVTNTVNGILALAGSGARHFMVGNIPDLGITPDVRDFGPGVAGLVTQLAYAYNLALEEQLQALEIGLGIHITRLDAFSILNQIAAEPDLYGLTNVTDRALWSLPAADPSEYLFWDGVHPTSATHEWTADFVCAALVQTYAPPKARGQGPRTNRALNGLVRASARRR